METKVLKNPYHIDFDQTLLTYAFFKHSHNLSEIDRLVSDFLTRVTAKTFRHKSDIILWRGEYESLVASAMWVIGVSVDIEEKVADELFRVVSGSYDDAGSYARINTGCEPYLLISENQVWIFNDSIPFNSEDTITIGTADFNVRYLACAHHPPVDDELHKYSDSENMELVAFLNEWSESMGESASENWEMVREKFSDFLSLLEVGVDYDTLLWICKDVICIPVLEVPMKSLGRTVVRPVWENLGNEFVVKDYSVTIAVQKELPENLKLLVLAHELGHYVHHHPHLIFFAQLYTTIQDRPWIEFEVLSIFDDMWPKTYDIITEGRADICASYFIIPHKVEQLLRATEKNIFSTSSYSADAQLMVFLRQRCLSINEPISFKQSEGIVKEAFAERKKALESFYDQEKSIFRRMVWSTFNRERYLKILNAKEADIDEKIIQAGMRLFTSLERKPRPKKQKKFIISRLDKEDFLRELSKKNEKWNPVVIESDVQSDSNGYIGVIPTLFEKVNHPEMQWTQWEAPLTSIDMDIDRLLQLANKQGKGVMFFPLSPIDMYLREILSEELSSLYRE